MKKSLSIFLVVLTVIAAFALPLSADSSQGGEAHITALAQSGLSCFEKTLQYTDGRFSDVRASDWFSANVASVYAYGLMKGNSESTFNPTGNITVAEAVTLLARIRAIYMSKTIDTNPASPWYQPYVNFVRDEGVFTEAFADYGAVISRADFARLLALSVNESDLKQINTVEDGAIPDVRESDSYAAAVYLLYRAGVLAGSDEKGTFNPATSISRAEAAALVTRIIDPSLRREVSLKAPVRLEETRMAFKNIFADGMLIQQKKPFSVTGTYTAAAGEYYAELCLGGKTVERVPLTLDPAAGSFRADFSARDGSYDKYTIRIMGGTYRVLELKDVIFGELWIATGESNMAYALAKDKDYPAEFVKDEYVRVMKVSNPESGYAEAPLSENPSTRWVLGSEQKEMENLTAVGYYFARNLREMLDVPVGLVFYAEDGAKVRSWISRETIKVTPALTESAALEKSYKPTVEWSTEDCKQTSAIYNTMLAPSLGLNAAGVIWYQGEADLGNQSADYIKELEALHKQYSRLYGYEDAEMPFIMASIMPYTTVYNPPYHSERSVDVAVYAAEYDKAAAVWLGGISPEHNEDMTPRTPNRKKPVGERLAASAMMMVYGKTGSDGDGPIAIGSTVSGNTVIVTFKNVIDGLCISDGSSVLRGFKLCGTDGVYYPANAKIVSKDKIEVSSPSVDKPISVAYAYDMNIYYHNLGCSDNGKLFSMAAPFVLDRPEDATFVPTALFADFDLPKIWHLGEFNDDNATEYDSWYVGRGTEKFTFTFESAVKAQGDASLKINIPSAGVVTVKPIITRKVVTKYSEIAPIGVPGDKDGMIERTSESNRLFLDSIKDFSVFGKIILKVKNDTDAPLQMKEFGISNVYALPNVTSIPAKSDWVEVSYDLHTLYGLSSTERNPLVFNGATLNPSIQFAFFAAKAGAVYLDDLQFIK